MPRTPQIFAALVALAGSGIFARPALAAAEASGNADVTAWTRYVWRGLRLSEGAVVQPELTVGWGAVSANIWGNYDCSDDELNEVDCTLSVAWMMGAAALEAGVTHFNVQASDDSAELYLSVSAETLGGLALAPFATLYYDIDFGGGAYLEAGVTRRFELHPRVALDLTAQAGAVLENRYVAVDAEGAEFSAPFDAALLAALAWTLHERVTLTPTLGFTFPLSDRAEEAMRGAGYGTKASTLYGAVRLSVTF